MAQEWIELLERRNRTSKTRRLYEDGRPTRKYSWDGQAGLSMHYLDTEAAWQDVDDTAEEADTDGFTVKFTKLSYFGRIDNEGRRRFYPDRNDLSYWIEFKKPYPNMGTPTRHNRWFYWDFAHATIGVRFDIDSLKFGFRLKDAQAPTSITIPFETQGITRQGRLLYHDGEVVAELRKPIATGSNFDADARPVRKECEVVFTPGEVTISLDPTDLEYPIEIDPTIDKQVAASTDDVMEVAASGRVYATDSEIRFGDYFGDFMHVGLRWTGISGLAGATIDTGATKLTFRATASDSGNDLVGDWYAHDLEAPPTFTPGAGTYDVSGRARTTATCEGDGVDFGAWTSGNDYDFIDDGANSIGDIIQELATDYDPSAIALLWIGTSGGDEREFMAWDGNSSLAAKLHIEYTAAGGDEFEKSVSGTLMFSGALMLKTSKGLAGSLTPSGALSKKTSKGLAGSLTPSGTLSTIQTFVVSLAGILTPTGALTKKTSKSLAGTLTSAGVLTRKTSKNLAGTLSSSGTLDTIYTGVKFLVGTLTSSGVLTVIPTFVASLAGTLSMAGALVKKTSKNLAGTLTSSGILTIVGGRRAISAVIGRVVAGIKSGLGHPGISGR